MSLFFFSSVPRSTPATRAEPYPLHAWWVVGAPFRDRRIINLEAQLPVLQCAFELEAARTPNRPIDM